MSALHPGETRTQGATPGPWWCRSDPHGHVAAIERGGYTMLQLLIGTVRNERYAVEIVEALNRLGDREWRKIPSDIHPGEPDMTLKELAELLNGREYRNETTPEIEAAAKESGLVIVFGASDDLMEFRGAIDDEIGAYEGAEVRIDAEGIMPDFGEIIDAYGNKMKSALRDYFRRENGGNTIHALWAVAGWSWTYATPIPHETFNIMEAGEPYCQGIVFALKDAARCP